MKDPGFQRKLIWLVATALFAVAGPGFAQPPEKAPTKRDVVRPKPQVIYHLPRSSNYAATLHSQAKGQNNDLPIDSDMPTSLQLSRANANAAAAKAREEAVAAQPAEPRPQQVRPPRVKRQKVQSVRVARPHPRRGKGPGHGGPKKSHMR
jgi:hypothetical protein